MRRNTLLSLTLAGLWSGLVGSGLGCGASDKANGSGGSGGGSHEGEGGSTGGEGGSSGDGGGHPECGIGVAPLFHVASKVEYPSVALRGYGALGGEQCVLEGGAGALSVLSITASDATHAALTHAKYLSDLGTLQAATPTTVGGVPAWSVSGQGTVVAFTSGSSVVIVAGTETSDIHSELGAMAGGRHYTATASIPMYLNRWDKYGFNFYYAPWNNSDPTYDYRQDFDYAKKYGGTGFAVWTGGGLAVPDAEGQLGSAPSVWVIESAATRGLAAILNDSTENSTPVWMLSQYRNTGELLERVPGFSGNECGTRNSFDSCYVPWGGGTVENALLGLMKAAVSQYGTEPNVVSILEPHGEQTKGPFDLFDNYGPVADANLQAFLKTRYASIGALDTAWYGGTGQVKSWSDVHAPGISNFAGHDQTAFDITGPWRALPGTSAPPGTAAPPWTATSFDDSTWALVNNDDERLLLPAEATALRTQFTPTGFVSGGSSWLYVWSLGSGCSSSPRAFLNGTELTASTAVPVSTSQSAVWTAYSVSSLGSGPATLALSLPACGSGYVLGYQTYLSNTAPALFPQLSATLNQQWVDFADWEAQMRGTSLANGMSMIRQVDLDKPIELMAPNKFMDLDKANAQDYGGTFHDTGFMSGFWIDELPAQMRSAGMPFSAEPGGPASSSDEFKAYFGNWITEGVNGVNYFRNMGDVTWNPAIEPTYRSWLPLIQAIGKYHGDHTDVAQLFSPRTTRMLGFPWSGDANLDINGGSTSAWCFGGLDDQYDIDAVTEGDFARGNAAQYKVIVDGNTSFMDDTTVTAIGNWIRAGGTFITFLQTGRHSPAGANTWPISTLTGYSVKSIDPMTYTAYQLSTSCKGTACPPGDAPAWALSEVAGQTLLQSGWNGAVATGLHMTKVASDAENVLMWPDGTVAVGVRTIGAGRIVTLGASFVTNEGWRGNASDETNLILQILGNANATHVPGHVSAVAATSDGGVGDASASGADAGGASVSFTGGDHFRHFVSNDGLFDVWVLHWPGTPAVDVNLVVEPPGATSSTLPTSAYDVLLSKSLPMTIHGTTSELDGIHLEQHDVRILLTARKSLIEAPRTWFELQRGWWQGTKSPGATPLPAPAHRYTIDLSTKYPIGEEGTPYASGWKQSFTVPSTWTGGTKMLWVSDWADPTMFAEGTVKIDTTGVWGPSNDGAKAVDITSMLSPGSTHTFDVTVSPGADTISGVRGEAWVRFLPTPKATMSLAGSWIPSTDGVTFTGSMTLPGAWTLGTDGIAAARTAVTIPTSWNGTDVSGTDIVLAVESQVGLGDVIINGQWVHSAANWVSTAKTVRINLTSFVNLGATNTIELFNWSVPSASSCKSTSCVSTLQLESYPSGGIYP